MATKWVVMDRYGYKSIALGTLHSVLGLAEEANLDYASCIAVPWTAEGEEEIDAHNDARREWYGAR